MKSRDQFKVLKRSLERCLSCLSEKSGAASVFPDPDFVMCILLMAVKIIEARQRKNAAESKVLTANHTARSLYDSARSLYDLVNAWSPNSVSLNRPLRNDYLLDKAYSQLSEISEELLQDDSTLGFSYQFLSMTARKKAQNKIQSANKDLSSQDLIAFTQIYTPSWVVDFLVENSVSEQLKQSRDVTSSSLRIIDPACGAGNFLVKAFDYVVKNYTSNGMNADLAVVKTLVENIFGADLDHAALWITSLALIVKALDYTTPECLDRAATKGKLNLTFALDKNQDDILGTLSRDFPADHILNQQYSIVLMNPPYIGRKLMSRQLKSKLKKLYPDAHNDICSAFIDRSLELLEDGGTLGVITQASLLTLPSYGDLRKTILSDHHFRICIDAGTNVFPLQGGDKVNSAILVIDKVNPVAENRTVFFDLKDSPDKGTELRQQYARCCDGQLQNHFVHKQSIFLEEHAHAIKYASPSLILKLSRQAACLADVAEIRQGLATSDNERFIRFLDDVPTSELNVKWFPYVKGAGTERWFSPVRHVVNWANDGAEIKAAVNSAYPYLKGNTKWVVKNEQFYFKEGLCFSFVNTGRLAVRKLPAGCIFDVGASALFAYDKSSEDFILAYLNSAFIGAIATSINPTINFQVGDLKRIPMFRFDQATQSQLGELARRCINLSMDLRVNPESGSALAQSEKLIDDIVFQTFCETYELTHGQREETRAWIERQLKGSKKEFPTVGLQPEPSGNTL